MKLDCSTYCNKCTKFTDESQIDLKSPSLKKTSRGFLGVIDAGNASALSRHRDFHIGESPQPNAKHSSQRQATLDAFVPEDGLRPSELCAAFLAENNMSFNSVRSNITRKVLSTIAKEPVTRPRSPDRTTDRKTFRGPCCFFFANQRREIPINREVLARP